MCLPVLGFSELGLISQCLFFGSKIARLLSCQSETPPIATQANTAPDVNANSLAHEKLATLFRQFLRLEDLDCLLFNSQRPGSVRQKINARLKMPLPVLPLITPLCAPVIPNTVPRGVGPIVVFSLNREAFRTISHVFCERPEVIPFAGNVNSSPAVVQVVLAL